MHIDDARRKAYEKINELKLLIGRYLQEPFDLILVGSLATGHYYGPKPKSMSANLACPFERIVEADLRLILHKSHPYDHRILNTLSEILNVYFDCVETVHWDKTDIPMAKAFWYETISEAVGFEWELCVNTLPYVDVALYWSELFTSQEIQWQMQLRKLVSKLNLNEDQYISFKWLQTTEARWRLVATFALYKMNINDKLTKFNGLPSLEEINEPVIGLVDKWLAGLSGYRTLERPTRLIPEYMYDELMKHDIDPVKLQMPLPPQWVNTALKIQNKLKMEINGRYN